MAPAHVGAVRRAHALPLLQRYAHRACKGGPHCRHVAPHLVRDRARDRDRAWVRVRDRDRDKATARVRVS